MSEVEAINTNNASGEESNQVNDLNYAFSTVTSRCPIQCARNTSITLDCDIFG